MSNSLLHASSIQALKRLGDPFNGYFKSGTKWTSRAGGLLDISNAKRWFEVIGWGSHNDLYTYQQALESKPGPRVQLGGQQFLMISSYDYLGLIGHPAIEAAAIEAIHEYGTSTGGVRLLVGTTALHHQFEKELATYKGVEAAMTFSSGYMANLGIISSLLGPDDRVIVDAKAPLSIVEACRLARVPMQRFHHNDPSSLQQRLASKPFGRRTLIVVEGVYSMDGDICPLADIVELKKQHNAFLMVDEAHSFGVLGATGKGVAEHFGLDSTDVDIWMGSLSKAIPSNGGYVAGGQELIIYLQHGAAPFMFSAALCPATI
ncbi:MAG: aminotransferase class I/II-fold pyridoxal phosphate-dependent enzyme, partial [bacterium]